MFGQTNWVNWLLGLTGCLIWSTQTVKAEATKKKTTTKTTTKVATKVEKAALVAKPTVIPVDPEPEVKVGALKMQFLDGLPLFDCQVY